MQVPEQEAQIKREDYAAILDPIVESELETVLEEIRLPYELADFQQVGVVALAAGKNVVMVVGTGEGKMTVPLLASLVIRRTQKKPKGVTVITQPLTGLMLEQLDNPVCEVAILSMGGELSDTADGKLSCNIEDVLDGKYSSVIGHPESFATPLGRQLLTALQRTNNLVLIVIDEFHLNSHWEAFRPEMMRLSTGLRAYSSRGAPVCVMTATAGKTEVRAVVRALGLEELPVMITSNPIQPHIKISVIKRPSNAYGFAGKEGKPGLWALLEEIYFRPLFQDMSEGRRPKKAIIFFRGMRLMIGLYSHLRRMTGHSTAASSFFVTVHSEVRPGTEKTILSRRDEILTYLSSNKMLLGLDLKSIDIVIFIQPYNMVAAPVQGGGRGGRKQGNGFRETVQVYQLWNAEDLTQNNKLMSHSMRTLCKTGASSCTRELLSDHFHLSDGRDIRKVVASAPMGCCHYCDLRQQQE